MLQIKSNFQIKKKNQSGGTLLVEKYHDWFHITGKQVLLREADMMRNWIFASKKFMSLFKTEHRTSLEYTFI